MRSFLLSFYCRYHSLSKMLAVDVAILSCCHLVVVFVADVLIWFCCAVVVVNIIIVDNVVDAVVNIVVNVIIFVIHKDLIVTHRSGPTMRYAVRRSVDFRRTDNPAADNCQNLIAD